jgi:hypothetical protein
MSEIGEVTSRRMKENDNCFAALAALRENNLRSLRLIHLPNRKEAGKRDLIRKELNML